jgi:hypothetical protein
VIFKEFSLESDHPLIAELHEMLEWARSSDISDMLSGRPDRNDLSLEQLKRRLGGVANNAWMSRFDAKEGFDHSSIQKHVENLYKEHVGATGYFLVPVAKTWYPKGGYLGWHIDNDGGRLYSSWADGKSFFRYRDPFTKDIVTSWDKPNQWTFRIFTFDEKNPLWHCVGAEDIRVSVGYRFVHHG